MVDVITDIKISASLGLVAAYASNSDNAPEWYVNIKSAVRLPAGEAGKTTKLLTVGSHIAFIAYFLDKELSYTYEAIELSAYKMVMRTADVPFPMETTYTWEVIDENTTRMTLRNRGNQTGSLKLFSSFISLMMKKVNQKNLKRIKEIIEKKTDAGI